MFLPSFPALLHLSPTVIFAVCLVSKPWHFIAILGFSTTGSDNKPWQVGLIIIKSPVQTFALVSSSVWPLSHLAVICDRRPGVQRLTGGSGGTGSRRVFGDLPSQLLFRYTDTNTGGTVKKSTTEFTSNQNHSLSLAAMNWKKIKRRKKNIGMNNF